MNNNYIAINNIMYNIKPIKLKYIRYDDFLSCYAIMKQKKLSELLQEDSLIYLIKFLDSVFEKDETIINNIIKDTDTFIEYTKSHDKLIEIVERVNDIDYELLTDKNDSDNDGISFEDGYSLLSIHCGFTEEDIDNFSYIHYKKCLTELAYKFSFEMMCNLMGDSHAGEKRVEMIQQANPLLIDRNGKTVKKNGNRLTISKLKELGIEVDTNAKIL